MNPMDTNALNKILRLKTARAEAQRFLGKVDPAIHELRFMGDWGRKHVAAAKRASMDLSRALTDVRK